MLGIPTHLAPRVNAWSLVRAFHAAAIAAILVAAALLVVYRIADPTVHVLPAVLALAPMLAALVFHVRSGSWPSAAVFLVVGTACAAVFAYVIERELGDVTYVVSYLVSLAIIPLVLVGGARPQASRVVLWSVLGFIVGRSAALFGTIQAAGHYQPAVLAWVTLFLVIGIVGISTSRARSAQQLQPELLRAAREEHVAAYRQGIEQEAAAILHDTILNHLNAIALAPAGPMDAHLARTVDEDFAMIAGREWLAPVEPVDAALGDDPLGRVIEENRAEGLDVRVTGDTRVVAVLDEAVVTALARAVGQCLVNVRKHAGTDSAEVSVFDDGVSCTVMVVDDGKGFDERETGSDRLGLKNSVRQRIGRVGGDVQVWSSPGTGTSVMMTVPMPVTRTDAVTVLPDVRVDRRTEPAS